MARRTAFSEGRTLCVRVVRPNQCQGISFPPHALKIPPVAYRPHASVKPVPSLRACGARPSAKWPSDAKKALRGKPRDNVEVGFLGGTHSVRPRSMAFRMPGHLIATRSVAERPGGLPVTCLGQARAILAGVRSPPLEGGTI